MNEFLAKYEKERQLIHRNNLIFGITGGLFMVIAFLLGITFEIPFLVFLFPVGLIMVIVRVIKTSKFSNNLKCEIVPSLVKEILGENSCYNMNGGLGLSDILSIGIYRYPDRYHISDYISATYNGIFYEMCDAKLEERHVTTDSKGNRRVTYTTYFLGRVIKIDIQRDFDFILKIIESAFLNIGNSKKIETEVIEFNKKFNVFCSNEEKAFYVLTPSMIQKMLELEKMYNGTINFYMDGRYFYVYINNSKDSLEIKLNKPFDSTYLDTIRSEIQIAEAIINEFGLDRGKYIDETKYSE
jgi:hypothetical protein